MIYTFYSYKGGVGRTMALANIAELFYRNGLRVLMVDWDLEAPGLERFFPTLENDEVRNRPGVMDLLQNYKQLMSQPLPSDTHENHPQLSIPEKALIDVYPGKGSRRFLFLSAGRRNDNNFIDYANAVLTFDWKDFYENWEGERYFNWLRQEFEKLADVVLIDSRTGITEMGGVCTYQLADVIVMFCASNRQNIEGTYKMARNFKRSMVRQLRAGRPLEVLPIPTRVELAEGEFLNTFKNDFIQMFQEFIPFRYRENPEFLWELRIPYVPYYAYNELVASRHQENAIAELLVDAFKKLCDLLKQYEEFLLPFNFKLSHLNIEQFQPSTYHVNWYQAEREDSSVTEASEDVSSTLNFSLARWRERTEIIGKTAFGTYLPNRTQNFVRVNNTQAIQLTTNIANVPWELLHDGNEFLCLRRPFARKPKMPQEPVTTKIQEKARRYALVIGNPVGDLPEAEVEAQEVTRMLKQAGVEVDLLRGNKVGAKEFVARLSNQPYDLIHYVGYGQFDPDMQKQSGLVFSDRVVTAKELEHALNGPAFLILNTSKIVQSTTKTIAAEFQGEFMEGFAKAALLGGAIGCLGRMWTISDQMPKDFTITLYKYILDQAMIGEAVRQARLAVYGSSFDFWASWVLYGDPLQSIIK